MSRRSLHLTSDLLADDASTAEVVLDFARRHASGDPVTLAVAVAPERAEAVFATVSEAAAGAGVELDADIQLLGCEDLAALRVLAERADTVLDSGCPLLAAATRRPAGVQAATHEPPLEAVVVSTYPSHPPQHGGALRVRALWSSMPAGIRADAVVIQAHGARAAKAPFTIASPGEEVQVERSPQYLQVVHSLIQQIGVSPDDLAASAIGPNDPYGQALRARLSHGTDTVVCAHPYLVRLVAELAPHVPVVYDAHNFEASLKEAMYPQSPAGRAAAQLVGELEAEACARAALVVCVSEDDREGLNRRYGVPLERCEVVPNGVWADESPFLPWVGRASHAPRCVFAGAAHRPNAEAVQLLAEAARQVPDMAFDIVGSVRDLMADCDLPANVKLHGRISEAAKQRLFREATVAANPMLSGSGTNLKLADFAAAGLPVVTTAVGARGFSGELVDCVSICEPSAAALAEALAKAHRQDWTERVARARAVVEREYDWAALAGRYAAALRRSLAAVAA